MTRIGFTGTRRGLTQKQSTTLWDILVDLQTDGYNEFHHGDCVGSDTSAALMATKLGMKTVSHPCEILKHRSFTPAVQYYPVLPPLQRNKAIVECSDVLVATPDAMTERLRSGTWHTIRYARKTLVRVIIIWPDGNVKEENCEFTNPSKETSSDSGSS
jgi:hypothetical protein